MHRSDEFIQAEAALLASLEQDAEEAKLQALRAALREGELSGPVVTFEWDDFVTRKSTEHTDFKT